MYKLIIDKLYFKSSISSVRNLSKRVAGENFIDFPADIDTFRLLHTLFVFNDSSRTLLRKVRDSNAYIKNYIYIVW